MIKILVIIAVLIVIAAAVYYFGFYKKGKINNGTTVYRVLAGPYPKDIAQKIVKIIKNSRDKTIFTCI